MIVGELSLDTNKPKVVILHAVSLANRFASKARLCIYSTIVARKPDLVASVFSSGGSKVSLKAV